HRCSRPHRDLHSFPTRRSSDLIACLYNVVEFYVSQTAEVAEALGLAGISPASAQLCLNKNLMRQQFRERIGPHAAARFQAIHSEDRKSTRLNSSHDQISYAVFC